MQPTAATTQESNNRKNVSGERLWSLDELREQIDTYETMLRTAGKSRQTIAGYTEHSERFLNWLDGRYTPREQRRGKPYGWTANGEMRSKYNPLRDYLREHPNNFVRLTFRDIEKILGQALPNSAFRFHHWWANDRTGNHAQAHAWMSVDRRVSQLNLLDRTVGFVRAAHDYSPSRTAKFG